jgi:hypothetical protein
MKKTNYQKTVKVLALALAIALNFLYFPAYAAGLTSVSDSASRLKASTASNHAISFVTPTGVSAGQTMTVTFPAGFTMSSILFSDVDLADNGTDVTLAGTPSGATWGAAVSGQVLTLTSGTGTIVSGHTVTIEIGTNATFTSTGVNQITNHATPATYVVSVGGTMADSGQYALSIVTDDQIPVTAVVAPSLTFTVANTLLDLGTISTSAVSTTGYNNITLGTNAHNGYTISIKDIGDGTSPGLNSSAAAHRIASATGTLVGGAEGYGANCNKVSGSGACVFADGTTQNVTGLTLAGTTFASYASKPTATDTFQVRVKAAIAATTEAGAYVDTLTLIGTANF